MKKEISWILAMITTIYLSVMQLIMSSSFPIETEINTGKQTFSVQLLRTFSGENACPIILPIEDISVSGYVLYHFRQDSININKIVFKREGDKLISYIPKQAPATEIVYQVFLEKDHIPVSVNEGQPIGLNFKGKVPLSLQVLNGLLIILVILLSNLTGFYAAFGVKSFKWMNYITIFALMFLGFFVHPLVQKFSMNTLWPSDWNFNSKILLVLITWGIALFLSGRKNYRIWPILASVISFGILLIPHQNHIVEPTQISLAVLERNFIALLQLF